MTSSMAGAPPSLVEFEPGSGPAGLDGDGPVGEQLEDDDGDPLDVELVRDTGVNLKPMVDPPALHASDDPNEDLAVGVSGCNPVGHGVGAASVDEVVDEVKSCSWMNVNAGKMKSSGRVVKNVNFVKTAGAGEGG